MNQPECEALLQKTLRGYLAFLLSETSEPPSLEALPTDVQRSTLVDYYIMQGLWDDFFASAVRHFERDEKESTHRQTLKELQSLVASPDPADRVKAAALFRGLWDCLVMDRDDSDRKQSAREQTLKELQSLVASPEPGDRVEAAALLGTMEWFFEPNIEGGLTDSDLFDAKEAFVRLRKDDSPRVRSMLSRATKSNRHLREWHFRNHDGRAKLGRPTPLVLRLAMTQIRAAHESRRRLAIPNRITSALTGCASIAFLAGGEWLLYGHLFPVAYLAIAAVPAGMIAPYISPNLSKVHALRRRPPNADSGVASHIRSVPQAFELLESEYEEAIRACLATRFRTAETLWGRLASQGHVKSRYSRGVLWGATCSPAYHAAAERVFRSLLNNLEYWARSRTGLALMLLARADSVDEATDLLQAVAQSSERDHLGERHAQLFAADAAHALGRLGTHEGLLDASWVSRALGHSLSETLQAREAIDDRISASLISVALSPDASRCSFFLRPITPHSGFAEVDDPETGEVFDSIEASSTDDSTHRALLTPVVSFAAGYLARLRLAGSLPGFLTLALASFGVAVLGSHRWLSVGLLAGGLILDTVDGRIARVSSKKAVRALYVDRVIDRLQDFALGLGLFCYFIVRESDTIALTGRPPSIRPWVLSFLFGCLSLFVPYVVSEGRRLRLLPALRGYGHWLRFLLITLGIMTNQVEEALALAVLWLIAQCFTLLVTALMSWDPVADDSLRLGVGTYPYDRHPSSKTAQEGHVYG